MANNSLKSDYLPIARKHVLRGSEWGYMAGSDYWLNLNSVIDLGQADSDTDPGNQNGLAAHGWTATSLVNTAGSGSDFMGGDFTAAAATGPAAGLASAPAGTFADAGTPNHFLTNASGDLLGSPAIFGDAVHARQAALLCGKRDMPRFLIAEFWAAFTVASADEVTSAIGFFEDGATISTEADQYAVIYSNGTNFKLNGNAANMATGPVIATTWHLWKIVLQRNAAAVPSVYAYRDGTIFSTTAGAGAADEFPLKFGFHALTTNRIGLGAVHIFYDW